MQKRRPKEGFLHRHERYATLDGEKIEVFASNFSRARVIDSHTGGEPTRVVLNGGPELGEGPPAERLALFREQHDSFRAAVVQEPRGSDVLVGALLCKPVDRSCAAGVIFFNNVGFLGMCGHGTIGLVVTLAHMRLISPGKHRIETPAGTVTTVLHNQNEVTVYNIASFRHAASILVDVPGYGSVRGDVAWGGNWFFLAKDHDMEIAYANVEALTDFAWRIRRALARDGISGAGGHEIDHIELFGASRIPGVDSKNFVLCPGKAFDRSPCGTGTSAKLACLFADGEFREGDLWRQESITGSIFEASVRVEDGQVYPSIRGAAFITAETELLFDPCDPFCRGISV